ncbi:MAG: indolepyruvate ferredoxin oxidoreductase subunit alpha [Chloroflexi bacterium]|uniref:Indolepyruvate ferredoxin oxidoreductase subunit alpha n=1 Tax=Candidatus Chlorohelix allophototropha TaxID=3003348 RepID=A0A8T7M2J5_9CHLR|nr:indolepyruvate ferredoxin oxidoreductase subunit alpha [Chloroflexota bacterium]WJW66534.1 indolepyruvate ferredoxin oxidoreductase subunit alpha [Chloroflexota bacterium L227-S17]
MGRNFSTETLRQLNFGKGQVLKGDMAVVVLKALLESGVSYLGGYPGAPTSSLYDAISDSYQEFLKPLGVYVEGSINEAAAAALLQASVNNPVRGAVNWKVVGNNVGADALAHISQPGLIGGAMVFVGEDYGLNSTSVAEKTLPYAHKSGLLCIDPRADSQLMADMVKKGFELSEVSGTIAMYLFRTRTGNMKGSLVCEDNATPQFNMNHKATRWEDKLTKIPLPPYSQVQERRKFEERMPAARRYIRENKLNDFFPGKNERIGFITQGMLYNTLLRTLTVLGEADNTGQCNFPIYNLNVIHPLVPEEIVEFLRDKEKVLIVEEGMPDSLETQIRAIAQSHRLHDLQIFGKGVLPEAGEYSPTVLLNSVTAWLSKEVYPGGATYFSGIAAELAQHLHDAANVFEDSLPLRLPHFCTGCPERPIFSALKLTEKKHGLPHYAGDIGCYIMGMYAPFEMTDTCTGMGTGLASAGAMARMTEQKTVGFLGDGTFWHSGLTTSIANATFNSQDATMVIFENGWTSMTGQQENPGTEENARHEKFKAMDIEMALHAAGVKNVVEVNPYKVGEVVKVLDKAFSSEESELKVIRSVGECMLERQRHEKVEKKERLDEGKRVEQSRFGIDDAVCTGDHSCIRVNGCPSLTIKDNPNPLRADPIATISNTCVGCGLCGEVAHAAVLCPSFYEAKVVTNPSRLERLKQKVNQKLIKLVFGAEV